MVQWSDSAQADSADYVTWKSKGAKVRVEIAQCGGGLQVSIKHRGTEVSHFVSSLHYDQRARWLCDPSGRGVRLPSKGLRVLLTQLVLLADSAGVSHDLPTSDWSSEPWIQVVIGSDSTEQSTCVQLPQEVLNAGSPFEAAKAFTGLHGPQPPPPPPPPPPLPPPAPETDAGYTVADEVVLEVRDSARHTPEARGTETFGGTALHRSSVESPPRNDAAPVSAPQLTLLPPSGGAGARGLSPAVDILEVSVGPTAAETDKGSPLPASPLMTCGVLRMPSRGDSPSPERAKSLSRASFAFNDRPKRPSASSRPGSDDSDSQTLQTKHTHTRFDVREDTGTTQSPKTFGASAATLLTGGPSVRIQALPTSIRGSVVRSPQHSPSVASTKVDDQVQGRQPDQTYNRSENSLLCLPGSNTFRLQVWRIVDSDAFEKATLLIIVLNSATLAMDNPGTRDNPGIQEFLFVGEIVFQALFAFEMLMKVIALGFCLHPHSYLRSGWNCMDALIVAVGFASFAPGFSNYSAVRLLRVMRPLRAVKRVSGLRSSVTAMLFSIPRLISVAVLLIFLIVVFAQMGIQLFAGATHARCYWTPSDEFPLPPGAPEPTTQRLLVNNDTGVCGSYSCESNGFQPPQFCERNVEIYEDRVLNFDNMLQASILVVKIVSLDDWPDDMEQIQRAYGWWPWVYFVNLTVIGSFFCINLFLAVQATEFQEAEETEADRLLQEQLQEEEKLREEEMLHGFKQDTWQSTEDGTDSPAGGEAFAVSAFQTLARQPSRLRRHSLRRQSAVSVASSKGDGGFTPPPLSLAPQGSQLPGNVRKARKMSRTQSFSPEPDEGRRRSGPRMSLAVGAFSRGRRASARWGAADVVGALAMPGVRRPTPPPSAAAAAATALHTNSEILAKAGAAAAAAALSSMQPSRFEQVRERLRTIICGTAFTSFIFFVTIVNIVVLATDHHDAPPLLGEAIEWTNLVASIIFIVELCLALFAMGFQGFFLQEPPPGTLVRRINLNGYNCLDFLLVVLSIPELVSGGGGSAFSAMRIFRLARLLRLVRRWTTMKQLISTMLSTGQKMVWMFVIMCLFVFIFGILGLQVFEDKLGEHERPNFDTLGMSFLTVFIMLTGEGWGKLMKAAIVGTGNWMSAVYFVSLFLLGNLMLLNLVVAMIIDNFKSDQEVKHDIMMEQVEETGQEEPVRRDTERRDTDPFSWVKAGNSDVFGSLEQSEFAIDTANPSDQAPPAPTGFFGGRVRRGSATIPKAKVATVIDADGKAVPSWMQLRTLEDSVSSGGRSGRLGRDDRPTTISCCGRLKQWLERSSRNRQPIRFEDAEAGVRIVMTPIASHVPTDVFAGTIVGKEDDHVVVAWNGERDGGPPDQLVRRMQPGSFSSNSGSMVGRPRQSKEPKHWWDGPGKPMCENPPLKGKSLNVFGPKNKFRLALSLVVRHQVFDYFVSFLIVTNMAFLAMDYPRANDNVKNVVYAADIVFTAIFTIELMMRVVVRGFVQTSDAFWSNPWNRIDLFVVASSYVTIAWPQGKLFRSLRTIRLVDRSQGLRAVTVALVRAIGGILNVSLVCFFIILVFAIIGVQLFKGKFDYCTDPEVNARADCQGNFTTSATDAYGLPLTEPRVWKRHDYHFNHLGSAMLALFIVAAGEGWSEVMYHAMDARGTDLNPRRDSNPLAALFFTIFVLCGSFFAVNVFIGQMLADFAAIEHHHELELYKTSGICVTEAQRRWIRAEKLLARLRLHPIPQPPVDPRSLAPVVREGAPVPWAESRPPPLSALSQDAMSNSRRGSVRRKQALPPGWARATMAGEGYNVVGYVWKDHFKIIGDMAFAVQETAFELAAPLEGDQPGLNQARPAQRLIAAGAEVTVLQPPSTISVAIWKVHYNIWAISTSQAFERCITFLIGLNVVVMCTEHYRQPSEVDKLLKYANYAFLSLFTLEAAIKLIGFGRAAYFGDPWNRFDFLLVLAGLGSFGAGGPGLHIARVLRVGRILRIAKRAQQVTQLGMTLLYALPALGNVAMLLLINFFIFGIAGVELFGRVRIDGNPGLTEYANFKNVAYSIVTLFQVSTTESWVDILDGCSIHENNSLCREADDNCGHQGSAVCFFVLFILLGSFVMLQLFATIVLSEWDSQQEADKEGRDTAVTLIEVERVTFTDADNRLRVIRAVEQGLQLSVDARDVRGPAKDVKYNSTTGVLDLTDVHESMVIPKGRRAEVLGGLKCLVKKSAGVTHNIPDTIPNENLHVDDDEVPQWLPVEPAALFSGHEKTREAKRHLLDPENSGVQGFIATKYFEVVGGLARLRPGMLSHIYDEMSERSRVLRRLGPSASVRVHQVQTQMLRTGHIRAADKLRLLSYFRSMWQELDPAATHELPVRRFLLLVRSWWLLRESFLAADELSVGCRVQVLANDEAPQARGCFGKVMPQFDKKSGQRVAHRHGRVEVKLQTQSEGQPTELSIAAASLRLCQAKEGMDGAVSTSKSVSALRIQRKATAARDRRESMARVGGGRGDMTDLFILQLLRVLPVPVNRRGMVVYEDAVQALSKQLFNVDPEHAHALQQMGAVRSKQWAHVDCRMVTHHFALQKISNFFVQHRRLRTIRHASFAAAIVVATAASTEYTITFTPVLTRTPPVPPALAPRGSVLKAVTSSPGGRRLQLNISPPTPFSSVEEHPGPDSA